MVNVWEAMYDMKRALTIAGSDSSGGAGLQADLRTFHAYGVYGMSAVTAVTVQNTLSVSNVFALPVDIVVEQIRAVLDDIGADVIKIGMIPTGAMVQAVAKTLQQWPQIPIVVDPVLRASVGEELASSQAIEALRNELLPLATVVTPNLDEAQQITGFPVRDRVDMRRAARTLAHMGIRAVVVKGGHLEEHSAADLLWYDGRELWKEAPRVATPHTHGTGCTFASAMAASIAQGASYADAMTEAKSFVWEALKEAPGFGHGAGPLGQPWRRQRRDEDG